MLRLYLLHLLIKGTSKALLFLVYQDVYGALAEGFECVGKDKQMLVSAQQDGFSVIFILAAEAHELSLGEAHHDHASWIVCRLYPSIKSHLLTEVKG